MLWCLWAAPPRDPLSHAGHHNIGALEPAEAPFAIQLGIAYARLHRKAVWLRAALAHAPCAESAQRPPDGTHQKWRAVIQAFYIRAPSYEGVL